MIKLRKKAFIIMMLFSVLVFTLVGCGKAEGSSEAADAQSVTEQEDVVQENETEEVTEETADEDSEQTATSPRRGQRKKVDINDYDFATFTITSEDLHDGVWDSVITNTENGSNVSPQLSWEPVEGAECYVVYMIDTMAANWVHWMSNNVTETELPQGWAPAEEYVGPYPPDGTHTYEIYVVALQQPVEQLNGKLDTRNQGVIEDIVAMDVLPDGTTGNLLGYGHIVGTYTHGD